MHYKNMDACQFERIQDDKKHWCLDHPDKCIGLNGMFDNVWGNAPAILSKVTDIYDIVMTDDACYSDSEIISEVERATEDVSSLISTLWGFDLKWDQSRQVTHIKRSVFKAELNPNHIEFGEYLAFPDMDDVMNYMTHMDLPSIAKMYTYVNQALHTVGLDIDTMPNIKFDDPMVMIDFCINQFYRMMNNFTGM